LSFEVCGREWVLVTPRSARRNATGLEGHRGAVVGVDGQLVRVDVLLGDGVGEELLGERTGFVGGEHPADDVARVDVDDAVTGRSRSTWPAREAS